MARTKASTRIVNGVGLTVDHAPLLPGARLTDGSRKMTERDANIREHRLPAVLFVDDEPGLRTLALEILQETGFEAITACDGVEALEQLSANPHIDVLISDIRMPRMGGEELLAIA